MNDSSGREIITLQVCMCFSVLSSRCPSVPLLYDGDRGPCRIVSLSLNSSSRELQHSVGLCPAAGSPAWLIHVWERSRPRPFKGSPVSLTTLAGNASGLRERSSRRTVSAPEEGQPISDGAPSLNFCRGGVLNHVHSHTYLSDPARTRARGGAWCDLLCFPCGWTLDEGPVPAATTEARPTKTFRGNERRITLHYTERLVRYPSPSLEIKQ